SATSTTLNEPDSVAVDSNGNLYIAERLGNRVRIVTTDGTIKTAAGTGTGGAPDAESGTATSQMVSGPQGVAVDAGGSVLIADSETTRFRRRSADGPIPTIVGPAPAGFGGDGDSATAARLRGPVGTATDAAGNFYVADTGNSAIRRVSPDGVIA